MHIHVIENPLFGLDYEIVDTFAQQNAAEQYCRNAGGLLASIKSRAERDFLDEFASKYSCDGR